MQTDQPVEKKKEEDEHENTMANDCSVTPLMKTTIHTRNSHSDALYSFVT